MESERIERAARLRAAGLSYAEIAEAIGTSRQHVHRILERTEIPQWGAHELRQVKGGWAIVSPDTDPRIIHALLKHALANVGLPEGESE